MSDLNRRPRIHSLGVHGVAFIELRRVPGSNGVEIVLLPKEGFSDFTLYVYGDGVMPVISEPVPEPSYEDKHSDVSKSADAPTFENAS